MCARPRRGPRRDRSCGAPRRHDRVGEAGGRAVEHDLEGAIQRLTGFLEQYWGGPGTYSEERGHPRLRMRHQPFRINPEARDHWLQHMRTAVDDLELAPADDALLWDYLERAAFSMINTFDD